MNDDQPTQPLTDADERVLNRDLLWAPGTDTITESQMNAIRTRHSSAAQPIPSKTALGYDHLMAHADRAALLAEVDRLRTELEGWKDNAEDTLRMYDKLKAESVGTTLGHLAKIERLQSQRDTLVRKLGLDWGPDAFGDLNA